MPIGNDYTKIKMLLISTATRTLFYFGLTAQRTSHRRTFLDQKRALHERILTKL